MGKKMKTIKKENRIQKRPVFTLEKKLTQKFKK